MLSKPYDIVVVFAIMAAVIVTIGFGINSAESLQSADVGDKAFFSGVTNNINSTSGLYGTSQEASSILDPEGQNQQLETDQDSIITQGLQSLRSLSSTYKSVEAALFSGSNILGVDPIYINLLMFTLIIIIFVLVYTWARGN